MVGSYLYSTPCCPRQQRRMEAGDVKEHRAVESEDCVGTYICMSYFIDVRWWIAT